jgi:signal transduction histidine kinase
LTSRDIAIAVAFLIAYVGLEWASFLHEYKGVPVTPWNPGLGVVFALIVLKGPLYGLVLLAGVITAETFVLKTELAWPVIALMAIIISASYTAAGVIARKRLHIDVRLSDVRDISVLLVSGAFGAALSATLLCVLLLVSSELRTGDLVHSSVPLLVGDIIGIAVMTPLVMQLWARSRDATVTGFTAVLPELLVLLAVIGIALWLLVGTGPSDYRLFSLLFLPVLVASLRHGVDGACVSLAAIQLGLVMLLRWHGHDAAAFTAFQVAMLVLTMSGLLVGVVVSERQRADALAEQAAARLKELQAEANRADRMSLVSGMASALAHEINQPMTAARALARSVQHILQVPEPDVARVNANLSNMIAQIDHAGGVVSRMREFLRRGLPHFSTLDAGDVLRDALQLARPEAAMKGIAMDLQVAPYLPTIFGDRIQLQQVVLNLIRNAMESIVSTQRGDGRIRIALSPGGDANTVEIVVADNGAGVAEGLPLFNPLFSSKKEGMGLGLSICASIVQAHGGRIWMQSSKAGATEFRFSLPTAAPQS